jgi:hypothetical protein
MYLEQVLSLSSTVTTVTLKAQDLRLAGANMNAQISLNHSLKTKHKYGLHNDFNMATNLLGW